MKDFLPFFGIEKDGDSSSWLPLFISYMVHDPVLLHPKRVDIVLDSHVRRKNKETPIYTHLK